MDEHRAAYLAVHAAFDPAHALDVPRAYAAITELRASELRFALIADCLQAAAAAGHRVPGELAPIRRLATALAISPEQLVAIATFIVAGADPRIDDLRAALGAVAETGVAVAAVTGHAHPTVPPPSYAAVATACERLFGVRGR